MVDWEPSRARRLGQEWRIGRFESDQWPSARMVCRQFGSVSAALEQAGLRARPAPSRLRANLSGPAAVTEAFLEWTRRYGDVPTMADWDPTRARRLGQDWRIARYHTGDWPSARSVINHFGSFAAAAAASGLSPRQPGKQHEDRTEAQAANRLAAARNRGGQSGLGIDGIAISLRQLASARAAEDPIATHVALIDLAGSALAWAETFGA